MASPGLSGLDLEFATECWNGVQESGRVGMVGLGTLSESLGIAQEALAKAVDGLGSEDGTMGQEDFLLMMERLLECGAVVTLSLPQQPLTPDEGASTDPWLPSLSAAEGGQHDSEAVKQGAFLQSGQEKPGGHLAPSWLSALVADDDEDEDSESEGPEGQQVTTAAWMGMMMAGEASDEEAEEQQPSKVPGWMRSFAAADAEEGEAGSR